MIGKQIGNWNWQHFHILTAVALAKEVGNIRQARSGEGSASKKILRTVIAKVHVLLLRSPIVWYNSLVKMILATVAMCLCGLVLAHEIGHALGLRDIYSIIGENEATRLAMPFRRQMATPADWNGGSGVQRFYRCGITLADIADRCLMNGDGDVATIDLPCESLVGWAVTNQVGNVKCYGFVRVPIGESKFLFTTNSFNSIMRLTR